MGRQRAVESQVLARLDSRSLAVPLGSRVTDAPPKPKRWRWLVAGVLLLCLIGTISWWNWSRPDARFVGAWRVGTDVTWTLTPDGRLLQIADGRPIYILDWAVSGEAFQMLPKREHWWSSAQSSIT